MDKRSGIKELATIKGYAKGILDLLDDETLDSFIHPESSEVQDAVAWRFFMMGDCAEFILRKYPKIDRKYPKLCLRSMRGMRGCLRNFHDGLDYPILWLTAKNELPDLIFSINEIIRDSQ